MPNGPNLVSHCDGPIHNLSVEERLRRLPRAAPKVATLSSMANCGNRTQVLVVIGLRASAVFLGACHRSQQQTQAAAFRLSKNEKWIVVLWVRAAAEHRNALCRAPIGPKALGSARIDTQKHKTAWLPGLPVASRRAGVTPPYFHKRHRSHFRTANPLADHVQLGEGEARPRRDRR